MSTQRIVVTGMGIVSCLGNTPDAVCSALREGRSGIAFDADFAAHGLASQVSGRPQFDLQAMFDRKVRRFLGDAAAYALYATQQALAHAGLDASAVRTEETAVVVGSGLGSTAAVMEAVDSTREKSARRVNPYLVPRTMASTAAANISSVLGTRGPAFTISSACTSSAHAIGEAAAILQRGDAEIAIAAGGDELHWSFAVMFDSMGTLATQFNAAPARASRPFARDRDGFVIAGGGGALILETLAHARQRGAPIIAELVAYASTSDGADMVQPSGEGAVRCMQKALKQFQRSGGTHIDYINAHGTGTPVGDDIEVRALRSVFGEQLPAFGSTKGLSGHPLGTAGIHEAIYSLLMLEQGFVAGSINCENTDDFCNGLPLVQQSREANLNAVMSNSFGFGGTNVVLIFQRAGDITT